MSDPICPVCQGEKHDGHTDPDGAPNPGLCKACGGTGVFSEWRNEYGELLLPEWRYREMCDRVQELNTLVRLQNRVTDLETRWADHLAGVDQ